MPHPNAHRPGPLRAVGTAFLELLAALVEVMVALALHPWRRSPRGRS